MSKDKASRVLVVLLGFSLCSGNCSVQRVHTPDAELKKYAEESMGRWIPEIGMLGYDHNDKGVINSNELKKLSVSALEQIKSLVVSEKNLSTIPEINFLPNLKYVDFSNLPNLSNIKAVEGTGIKTLIISNTPVKDISPISNCTSLEEINLINTQIVEIPDLSGLSKVKKIKLNGSQIVSLENINTVPSDFDLYIMQCFNLSDIDALLVARVNTLYIDKAEKTAEGDWVSIEGPGTYDRLEHWFDTHLVDIRAKRPQFQLKFEVDSGE
jgi:Leucine-rich repeat (LRR) protein